MRISTVAHDARVQWLGADPWSPMVLAPVRVMARMTQRSEPR
jgi:hypothetical protein